jgi:two-component system chemotaxis sensor kinase CheA
MTVLCDDQELLEEFLTEATELLEQLDDDLITLERVPGDMELLNRIFRSIHTVKGAASFLEFELLVKVTHKTEDVLNKLRKGELAPHPANMDVILEAINLVKVLINDIKGGELKERPVDGIIDRLVAILTVNIVEGAAETPLIEQPTVSLASAEADATTPQSQLPAPESGGCPIAEEAPSAVVASEPAELPAVAASEHTQPAAAAKTTGEELTDKSTVRVDVKRVDDLMNQVGELVLERNRMMQLASDYQNETNPVVFGEEFAKLAKRMNFVTSELQMQVLKMRLIPVGNVFKKFPRIVRNLARDLGKKVELRVFGEDTELDRSVVDQISDPLIHLLRNSMDHGLETPEERVAAGKPPSGTIVLSARHEGNRIIISIKDDGRGIDCDRVATKALEKGLITQDQLANMSQNELLGIIFLPGFSTKEVASDLSGRGVGMDVVRTNIEKLNGTIDIKNEKGQGSEFILKLPLTLAIIQSLLVEVERETYSIPLSAVLETIRVDAGDFHIIGGRKVLRLRESVLPIVTLAETFNVKKDARRSNFCYVVVVGVAERKLGLVVSRLLGQQEVAIKSLGNYLANVPGIAGSTIMGDGRVALIVDPAKLTSLGETTKHGLQQPA